MQLGTVKVMWGAIVLTIAVTIAALRAIDVQVRLGSDCVLPICGLIAVLFACFVVEPQSWVIRRVLNLGNGLLMLSAIGICGALLSYWTMRMSPAPWADPLLYEADQTLGFDWAAIYGSYRHHSTLTMFMQAFYTAIFRIPLIVVVGLALSGQEDDLRDFLLVFVAALFLTIAVSAFFPAQTPLYYLIGNNPPYVPATGLHYLPLIEALRSATPMQVDINHLDGILTFPSFHAASAVVYAWAGWRIKHLRWLLVFLNLGMLVATPMEGAHYFTDVIAGVLVAGAAILMVKAASQKRWVTRSDLQDQAIA